MKEKNISEVIDMAIQREEDAITFYSELNKKIHDQSIKDTLEWIAGEEKKHKTFLVNYREGRQGPDALKMRASVNYKIAEYLEEPPVETVITGADVFLMASHRELKSFKFYSELARLHPEGDLRTTLLKIASEELAHKEKMEYLYSNTAFPQTAGG